MTPITVPPIFYDFASDYALDATKIEDGKGLDDMGKLIDNALQYHTDPGERAILRGFLNDLIEMNVPNEKLQQLWQGSSARLANDPQSYRNFFAAIRDRL